jgi:hypothetical protein
MEPYRFCTKTRQKNTAANDSVQKLNSIFVSSIKLYGAQILFLHSSSTRYLTGKSLSVK